MSVVNRIDHVAIGAATLEAGQAHLEALTGLVVPRGSRHDLMGTHNCVMQAGNESFLEIIAIDSDAPDPGRRRWFTLDQADTQSRLGERPRALCWVVNTTDLDAIVARATVDLGEIVRFQRGDRSWRLTVPRDGSLPLSGLIPAFIEWSPGPHPSTGQQDLGARLERIILSHPDPDWLAGQLDALGVGHLADFVKGEVGLTFALTTPNGRVEID